MIKEEVAYTANRAGITENSTRKELTDFFMKEVNKTWHWMVEHPSDWLYDKYCDRIRDHLMLEYKMHRLAADTCAVSLLERTLRELRYDELHKNYVDNLDTNAHKHPH